MENKEPIQVTDPEVTRVKFENEIQKFRTVEDKYRAKGILCTKVIYPNIYFVFGIPKLIPYPIVFSVKINFTNYDIEPPSVKFINPFTEELLKREQIPIHFIQINNSNLLQPLELVQGVGDIMPFFCIPGIREYHDHPAHSGDSWLLYRDKGEGGLLFVLDQLYSTSIPMVKGYQLIVNHLQTVRINQEIVVQQNLMLPQIPLSPQVPLLPQNPM